MLEENVKLFTKNKKRFCLSDKSVDTHYFVENQDKD